MYPFSPYRAYVCFLENPLPLGYLCLNSCGIGRLLSQPSQADTLSHCVRCLPYSDLNGFPVGNVCVLVQVLLWNSTGTHGFIVRCASAFWSIPSVHRKG